MLRRADGSQITDIDAAILDRETASLALIQLKWLDTFGMSPRERESKRSNLIKANEWVDRVARGIDGRNARQVALALGLGNDAAGERPPIIMVIPRYSARFTLNGRLDDRACWASWAEVMRMRIEQKTLPIRGRNWTGASGAAARSISKNGRKTSSTGFAI